MHVYTYCIQIGLFLASKSNSSKSIDEELDKAADTTEAAADDELQKLKEQLGFNKTKK